MYYLILSHLMTSLGFFESNIEIGIGRGLSVPAVEVGVLNIGDSRKVLGKPRQVR